MDRPQHWSSFNSLLPAGQKASAQHSLLPAVATPSAQQIHFSQLAAFWPWAAGKEAAGAASACTCSCPLDVHQPYGRLLLQCCRLKWVKRMLLWQVGYRRCFAYIWPCEPTNRLAPASSQRCMCNMANLHLVEAVLSNASVTLTCKPQQSARLTA